MSINYKKPYKEQFAKVLGPHGTQGVGGADGGGQGCGGSGQLLLKRG